MSGGDGKQTVMNAKTRTNKRKATYVNQSNNDDLIIDSPLQNKNTDINSLENKNLNQLGSNVANIGYVDDTIFEKNKLIVFIDPLHHESPGIMIHSAQKQFFDIFLYSSNFKSFSFDRLVGQKSCLTALRRINNAVLIGKSHLDNVVLYRSDGKAFSCHLAIQCISGNPNSSVLSNTPDYPRSYRWAVITIRSLSLVEKAIRQVNQYSNNIILNMSNSGNSNNNNNRMSNDEYNSNTTTF